MNVLSTAAVAVLALLAASAGASAQSSANVRAGDNSSVVVNQTVINNYPEPEEEPEDEDFEESASGFGAPASVCRTGYGPQDGWRFPMYPGELRLGQPCVILDMYGRPWNGVGTSY